MICRRYRISGRVQGVFFRDSTRRQAGKLGLSGYARNMPDCSVDVLACGDEQNVARLAEWFWQGSPMSAVTDVQCISQDMHEVDGFDIG